MWFIFIAISTIFGSTKRSFMFIAQKLLWCVGLDADLILLYWNNIWPWTLTIQACSTLLCRLIKSWWVKEIFILPLILAPTTLEDLPLSTWVAEAPNSRSKLSSFWTGALRLSFSAGLLVAQVVETLELQSMDSVCLVLAILDLYMVGVRTRNWALEFL